MKTIEKMLAWLRGQGYTVAVHNDYRQHGVVCTFWLFTHSNGTYLKAEGMSDREVLQKIIKSLPLWQQPKIRRSRGGR